MYIVDFRSFKESEASRLFVAYVLLLSFFSTHILNESFPSGSSKKAKDAGVVCSFQASERHDVALLQSAVFPHST